MSNPSQKKRIVHIVGARPNFMKLAPLWRVLDKQEWCEQTVIHTGQHYSPIMSDTIFDDLDLPPPEHNLNVNSGNHLEQMTKMISMLKERFAAVEPDLVVVYGDVNSTLAGTMAAKFLGYKVAHVEAGLRSRDLAMPEERNRVYVDHMADIHLGTSDEARENLITEGVSPENISIVGNLMVDSLFYAREKVSKIQPNPLYTYLHANPKEFALLTLHRPGNVDDQKQLSELFLTLGEVGEIIPIIFPIHPRTRDALVRFDLLKYGQEFSGTLSDKGIHFLPPLSYLDFVRHYGATRLVLTDSGGIQEETTVLDVPCLTLRENTERPITVTHGTNTLVGSSRAGILAGVEAILSNKTKKTQKIELWDGKAGERIACEIFRVLNEGKE